MLICAVFAWFATMPERNAAIVQAWATRYYIMKETAQAFEVHREPVSRIVKKMNLNV